MASRLRVGDSFLILGPQDKFSVIEVMGIRVQKMRFE